MANLSLPPMIYWMQQIFCAPAHLTHVEAQVAIGSLNRSGFDEKPDQGTGAFRGRESVGRRLRRQLRGKQAVVFLLDHAIALARALLEAVAVEDLDVAAPVLDQPGLLQAAGRLGDAFAAYPQHVCD